MRNRAVLACIILSTSCGEDSPRKLAFTVLGAETGLDFRTTAGSTPSSQILEVKGGGVALIDHDRDGDLDIFVPNGATLETPDTGPGSRLFENKGQMAFIDVTKRTGIELRRWAMGVAVGDTDSDGWRDLYVTCYGANAQLQNLGGKFRERQPADSSGKLRDWSTAAAFGDLDRDGDLDLYVTNYLRFDPTSPPPPSNFKGAPVFKGPRGLPPQADRLYRNGGDGSFEEIAEGWGRSTEPAFGLGVVILDFDADGTQDVFVGNDSGPNFLYRNAGLWRFEENGARTGLAANVDGSTQSTMGIGIGDVSGNGFPDVFTTNFSNDTNTLHINKTGRFFDDETRRYGLGMRAFALVGWACGFHDFDHDADEDLLFFNGHVYPNATYAVMDSDYRQPPMLYERDGSRFLEVGAERAGPFLTADHCDRGAAFGDLDRDGDIDVVVSERNGPLRILRNDTQPENWLIIELAPNDQSSQLGAKIELIAGTVLQTRWIYSGGSFLSSSPPEAHFGLPAGCNSVTLRIHWPDGTTQELARITPNQHLSVER